MTHHISVNVRLQLWAKSVPRRDWALWLSERTRLSRPAILGLVRGELDDASVSESEVSDLAIVLEGAGGGDALRRPELVSENHNVALENVRYLLGSLERGGKSSLARALGVDPTTVSRWLSGSSEPERPTLGRLVAYFGLPSSTDLRSEPIFLLADPLSSTERRKFLRELIEALPDRELQDLFPALKRLLEEE